MSAMMIFGAFSAVLGAIGTVFLYRGTFGLEGFQGYQNAETIKAQVMRNRRWLRLQRMGLSLLMLSFVSGVVSVGLS